MVVTDVAVDKNVVVSFSEAMNKTDGAVGVLAYQAGDGDPSCRGSSPGMVAGTQMTFNPSANLGANTVYEIKDLVCGQGPGGQRARFAVFASSFRSR